MEQGCSHSDTPTTGEVGIACAPAWWERINQHYTPQNFNRVADFDDRGLLTVDEWYAAKAAARAFVDKSVQGIHPNVRAISAWEGHHDEIMEYLKRYLTINIMQEEHELRIQGPGTLSSNARHKGYDGLSSDTCRGLLVGLESGEFGVLYPAKS